MITYKSDFEFQEMQIKVTRWLNGQKTHEINKDGVKLTLPVEAATAFTMYTKRVQGILDEDRGARIGWEAMQWIASQAWGASFWKPEFIRWANLYMNGEFVKAEKYFWSSLLDAEHASGWTRLTAERVGLLTAHDMKKLRSAEWEELDEWGLYRPTSGT